MNLHSPFHDDDANLFLFTSHTLYYKSVIQWLQYSYCIDDKAIPVTAFGLNNLDGLCC